MKRRSAIKQLGLITTGTLLLPSCIHSAKEVTVALKNITLTGQQEATIMAMVQTIIPATDTPGAKDLGVGPFVLRMVDDCCDTETQQKFMAGLAQAEKQVGEQYGDPFDELEAARQLAFLQGIEDKMKAMEDAPPPAENAIDENNVPAFYATLKRFTVRGYLNSEYVLGTVFGYTLVPGRFTGTVELTGKADVKTIMG